MDTFNQGEGEIQEEYKDKKGAGSRAQEEERKREWKVENCIFSMMTMMGSLQKAEVTLKAHLRPSEQIERNKKAIRWSTDTTK